MGLLVAIGVILVCVVGFFIVFPPDWATTWWDDLEFNRAKRTKWAIRQARENAIKGLDSDIRTKEWMIREEQERQKRLQHPDAEMSIEEQIARFPFDSPYTPYPPSPPPRSQHPDEPYKIATPLEIIMANRPYVPPGEAGSG